MASLSGLGSATGNSASSIRGYGGLSSGLDRDSLIESMTYATRSKIAQQKQKQQTITWKQTAMRSITSQMYEFSNKFMSYTSSSNLLGSTLFSRNQITANGANSKYVSVSGAATGADMMSVLGVKQLAKNAQAITGEMSSKLLESGSISSDLTTTKPISTVAGESLTIKYGNQNYYVTLKSDAKYDYSTPESTAQAINELMKDVDVANGKKLSDVVKVEFTADAGAADGSGKLSIIKVEDESIGNNVELAGGTGDILKNLGFLNDGEKLEDLPTERKTITSAGLDAQNNAKVLKDVPLYELFSEKQINFSYNGTTKSIKLDKYDSTATAQTIQDDMNKKLADAFGKNRVRVDLDTSAGDSFRFQFKTIKPDGSAQGYKDDETSTLILMGGDKEVVGKMGLLGISSGVSNRLNLSSKLENSGLKGFTDANWTDMPDGEGGTFKGMTLSINGSTDIIIKQSDSINSIMKKINESDAKVKVSYQPNSDRFTIESTEKGASGNINITGEGAKLLFGSNNIEAKGQDAIIAVQYSGVSGSSEITRDSNTISIDGLNITLKGEFGYKADGTVDTAAEAVTFDASVNTENTVKAVKEMVEAYNKILESINSEVSQKPNRKYAPLTDEQRAEMSESQIEKWEEEAKKGMLFNDSDMRSLMDKMRFILPTEDRAAMAKIGISVSTNYKDNGKLVLDEEAFKTALNKDPEAVQQLFTRESSVDENGNKVDDGLMQKMKTVMDRYASMRGEPKGILVQRAGSIHAPTSVLTNSYQKQLDELDDYIDTLTDRLKTEQDRYISQFTSLETLINQMNSQSSSLSGFFQ